MSRLEAKKAVMIGDTPYDVVAASRAHVPAVAVLTGGFSEAELRDAGAACVFESIVELAGTDESQVLWCVGPWWETWCGRR
jgi:phosphoglycolate phosphatase-like HAD superfamily hydrolase